MKKKIFSVFSALTLICQVGMSAPLVMAEEETAVSSKVGLIYEFDGSGGMYIPEDLTSTPKVEYNVDGYATFEGEGTWKDGAGANSKTSPYVYASLGEDKIKFEDDKAVIIETKVRFRDIDEAFNAVKIGYNLPASGIDTFYAMDKTNNADVQYASNLITHMVEFRAAAANNGFIRFGIGNYWSGDIKYTSASAIADQWYTVIIRIKPGFIFDYYVLNADGTYIAYLQDKDQTYVTKSEYFENVAFAMTHGTYGTKTDIDYIKVYNIPLNVMDDYKDYKKAYNEKADKFTLNLSGDESDTWVAASGITPTISVNQKDADGTDYTRMIPAAANDYMYVPLPQKIKLNDNNTVIIDARIRGYDIDGGVGRMQLKWNMPTVSSKTPALIYNGTDEINATYNEALGKYTVSYTVGANHLVLADFLKDGLRLSDGIIKSMPAQTSWNTNLYGVTKGNINSKWWRMVVQIKPGYEVVYKLYDENNNPLGSEQTGTLGWVEQSGYLRNVAIQSFNGKLAYADVDYLNVYNVPLGEEDDFDKVEGTIDGVELDEVGKVDPNKAVVKINTAYDINKAVISYNAWDGETETLLKGVDYTVEEEEENSYVIEFDKTLKRSATYTIALTDTVKVEFDTEKAPETLYYDGFSSKTSLDDWELDFSGTYGDATVSDEEKIDVENGKLVVSGDRNVSDSETYAKLTAANIYSYKHGKQWNNYEYSLVWSAENSTQFNVVARYKREENYEKQYLYGVASKYYVQYSKGADNRIYFGYMRGANATSKNDGQPLSASAEEADYNTKYNTAESITEPQRKYEDVLKLNTKYKTVIRMDGLKGYWSVESADGEGLLYESAPNGEMIDMIYSSDTNPGTVAVSNGLYDVYIDNMTVKDRALTFSIDGETKAVDNNGIDIVFSKEIASADGVVVKDTDGKIIPSVAVLGEDRKNVNIKVASIPGEYVVEVSGIEATDGTKMQEEKKFGIITTEGEEYKLTIEKLESDEDTSAVCKVSHPEVLLAKGAVLYIAAYDETGRLVSVDCRAVSGEETTVAVQKSDMVKIFLWDNNMSPIEY